MHDRDDPPYRTPVTASPTTKSEVSRDEQNYDTLKIVAGILDQALIELDKWHAFDTKENELKIKQQIVAHQIAFDIVSPVADMVTEVVAKVDQTFKERQGQT